MPPKAKAGYHMNNESFEFFKALRKKL